MPSPGDKSEVAVFENKYEDDTFDAAAGKEAQVAHVGDIDEGFDPDLVRRTMRKVDYRLIPILCAMYTISLIDRTNLSTARAANNVKMDKELGTQYGQRYTIITLAFFIPVSVTHHLVFRLDLSSSSTFLARLLAYTPSTSSLRSRPRLVFASLVSATGSQLPSSSGVSS